MVAFLFGFLFLYWLHYLVISIMWNPDPDNPQSKCRCLPDTYYTNIYIEIYTYICMYVY